MKKLTKLLCLCLAIVIVAGLVPYRALAKESITETSEAITEKSVLEKDELTKQHMPPIVARLLWIFAGWLVHKILDAGLYAACKDHIDFIWAEWQKGEWYSWEYGLLYGTCRSMLPV